MASTEQTNDSLIIVEAREPLQGGWPASADKIYRVGPSTI